MITSDWTSRSLSMLVENRFGVLFQITGLLSARGYNIESLHVEAPSHASLAHIRLTVCCRREAATQVIKQLLKLADVVSVDDLSGSTNEKENPWHESTMTPTPIEVF